VYIRQAETIWKPDIILYNNADRQYNSGVTSTNAIVTSVCVSLPLPLAPSPARCTGRKRHLAQLSHLQILLLYQR
jgi:hypothetical protein